MDGAATLKQIAIKIEAEERKPVTINLNLFTPERAPQPAPAFLLICNRSVDDIDPTRKKIRVLACGGRHCARLCDGRVF